MSPHQPPSPKALDFFNVRHALRGTFAIRGLSSVALAGLVLGSVALAADATKTYTLFEGNNIAVGQGQDVYPVRDVRGGAWVTVVNGKEVLVSGKSGPIAMKVTPLSRLSDVSVTFANLKTERAYTFRNDPTVRFTRSMGQAALLNAGYQAATNQAAAAQSSVGAVNTAVNNAASGNASIVTPSSAPDQAMTAAAAGPGADLVKIGANDAEGNFDALDVSFEISSPRPLSAPYIVTTTRIHEPGAPAGSFRNVVFARALEPVGATAMKVEYQQANFPFGYLLEGYEIHIYDGGREVASNLAPKRQVLSFDQAFEHVRGKYLETHKTATLAAVPVMGDLPHDFAAEVATGKHATAIHVKVSKEGLAHEAFSDAACTTRIDDPFTETVVRAIRFSPALEDGKPVEGIVSLDLGKLRM